MNLKRALLWGLIYWVVAYSLGSLIFISPWQKYISQIFLVLAPILTLIFAWLYFRQSTSRTKFVEGLKVAFSWVVLSVGLDAIFIVAMVTRDFGGYFGRWQIWMGYIEMIILVIVMSLFMKHQLAKPTERLAEKSSEPASSSSEENKI